MKAGYAYGIGSGVAWGLSGVVIGIAVGKYPFAAAPSLLAAPLAAAALTDGLRTCWQVGQLAATHRLRGLPAALRTRHAGFAMLAALAGGPLATSCYFVALVYSGITYAYALSAMAPALGALLAAAFLRERLPARAWSGMLLIIAGTVVVSFRPPEDASPHFYLGLLFALGAAVGWAFEGLFAAKAMERLDAAVANLVRQALSLAVFLALLLPLVPGAYGVFVRAFDSLSLIIFVAGTAVSAGGYLLYFTALGKIGPGRAMPINLTYVLWAALFSLLLTGTKPSWQLLFGAAAVVAGTPLVVLERRSRREASAPQAAADQLPPCEERQTGE